MVIYAYALKTSSECPAILDGVLEGTLLGTPLFYWGT